MKQSKKTKYKNDILLIQKFIKDVDELSTYNDHRAFYTEDEFWQLLLLLSRGFLNNNFHKLFSSINKEYTESALLGTTELDNFTDNCFPYNRNEILTKLISNQYIRINDLNKNYQKVFKTIRNCLSHYSYEIKNNIIIINPPNNKEIEISIASLVIVLLATLSNCGQSTKKGMYDTALMVINNELYETRVTNKIDSQEITPLDVTLQLQMVSALCQITFNSLNIHSISKNDIIEAIKKTTNSEEKILEIKAVDTKIENAIYNYCEKINYKKLDNQDFTNLYFIIEDDVKRATILYKYITEIIYSYYKGTKLSESISFYLPIIKNMLSIIYANIVFCDYAYKQKSTIEPNLFKYIKPENYTKIPRRIRNSIAHCRYRFEDITNPSSNIIIEFWDGNEEKIDFECEITKGNFLKLTNEYAKLVQGD